MSSQADSHKPIHDKPPVTADAGTGDPHPAATSGRDAYNIVSDTFVGVNVRKSDNLFQLKVILVCVLILGPLGAIAAAVFSPPEGRLIGSVGGGLGMACVAVVLGLFGSGIYLMIYRAIRHVKGKHD